jgi:hypothetical protein
VTKASRLNESTDDSVGSDVDLSLSQAISDLGDGRLSANLVLIASRGAANADRADNFVIRFDNNSAGHQKHARKMLQ